MLHDSKEAQKQTVDYLHYGYSAKMSRMHAIFVVRHTLWRLTKAKLSWELILYDQTKYFDLIERAALFRDLRDCGLSSHDIQVFEATLNDSCYEYTSDDGRVRVQKVVKGVVQGGRESAMLSLGPMNRTLRSLKTRRSGRFHVNPLFVHLSADATLQFRTTPESIHIASFDVGDAAYADDVASITVDPVNCTLKEISDFCNVAEAEGLHPNLAKFETIRRFNGQGSEKMSAESAYSHTLPNRPGKVPVMESVKYLGDHVDNTHTNRREIAHRVRCARSAFNSLARQIWRNRSLTVSTLRTLFISIVRCHLVGALECYALTKSEVAQLERLQNVFLWKVHCARTRPLQQPRDYADRPTAEALRVWLQISTVESQLAVSRVDWLVTSINHGPAQFWGLVAGIFEFETQAPKSPWHELWEKDLLQIKSVLGDEIPAPADADALSQFLASLSKTGRKTLLGRCLSFRNWETLDRDVFCPDCSARFLDDRWLRFHQKRVHHDPLQTPEDALLDVPEYNPNGMTCPCCRFSFSCRVALIHHVRKRKVCQEGLRWMWQEYRLGHRPIFPICDLAGKAKSRVAAAEIPNRWRSFSISRMVREVLIEARQSYQGGGSSRY